MAALRWRVAPASMMAARSTASAATSLSTNFNPWRHHAFIDHWTYTGHAGRLDKPIPNGGNSSRTITHLVVLWQRVGKLVGFEESVGLLLALLCPRQPFQLAETMYGRVLQVTWRKKIGAYKKCRKKRRRRRWWRRSRRRRRGRRRKGARSIWSYPVDQFHVKLQPRVRRNFLSAAARPISIVGANGQQGVFSSSHRGHALVPSFYDL